MPSKRRKSTLPYLEDVAYCYEALDLPYGAPMAQVTKRWQDYLAKCHPDLHQKDQDKLPAAFKLTGVLTWAHGQILEAWQRHGQSTSALPFSSELAECYAALDLPYGAPMDQVTKRWREYLKKCHPDRHMSDPDRIPDANKLTRILTQAHDTIRDAWKKMDHNQ